MPVKDYGVVAGTFDHFDRDDPANYGNYFHGQIFVKAPPPSGSGKTLYRCAVDVKMPNGVVEYVRIGIKAADIASILSLSDGLHLLASNPSSGALDYVRSPFIGGPIGCAYIFYGILDLITGKTTNVWTQNVGGSVLDALETMFTSIKRIYVFGSHFHNTDSGEDGMHDVHMNQGDPLPVPGDPDYTKKKQWYDSDAIWQDGGVLVEHVDDQIEGFFIKFLTQSLNTDDTGHIK